MLLLLTCLINICLVSTQLKKNPVLHNPRIPAELAIPNIEKDIIHIATNAQFTKIQVRNKVSKKVTQGKDRKREPCGQPFV